MTIRNRRALVPRLLPVVAIAISFALAFDPSAQALTGGSQLWASRYNGPGNEDDEASSVAITPDGSTVFITGYSRTGNAAGYDFATLAHDASIGAKLWTARYNGTASGDDWAVKVASSSDGSRVFVTGYSEGSGGSTAYATLAYDSTTGAQLWVRRYGGPGGDAVPNSLAVSPDGASVFVTGASQSATAITLNYATIAYDAATGATRWVRHYNGPANESDHASSLAVSPDSSTVFVTGGSQAPVRYNFATIAYNADTGARLWVQRYKSRADSNPAPSLGVSPDGSRVFVTGKGHARATGYDYVTIAYQASSGSELWISRYDRAKHDLSSALTISPDGSTVFVTGDSETSTSSYDYATVAYDASSGGQLWVSRYDGPASSVDYSHAIAVTPDGAKVLVTGESDGSLTAPDFATVAYDSTNGTTSWVSRYVGPVSQGWDSATSIVLSPGGSAAYVGGYSQADLNTFDYALVAYSI